MVQLVTVWLLFPFDCKPFSSLTNVIGLEIIIFLVLFTFSNVCQNGIQNNGQIIWNWILKFYWLRIERANPMKHAIENKSLKIEYDIGFWFYKYMNLVYNFESSINKQMFISNWLRRYPRLINRLNLISINNILKIASALNEIVHRFQNYKFPWWLWQT